MSTMLLLLFFLLSLLVSHSCVVIRHRPDYRETALYGRKWINRLVLQLVSIKEIADAPADADSKSNRFVQGQKLVVELTEGLLMSFVQKEEAASRYGHSILEEVVYKRYTALVHELLSGYGNMETEYLQKMSWISPVLLGSCIRSKNEEIRLMVQKLVSRTSGDSTSSVPYPSPTAPKSAEAKEEEAAAAEPAEALAPSSETPPAEPSVEPAPVDEANGNESAKAVNGSPNGATEESVASS